MGRGRLLESLLASVHGNLPAGFALRSAGVEEVLHLLLPCTPLGLLWHHLRG